MPEGRMNWSWCSAGGRPRGVGVLIAALALLSTPLASGVAAADSNRATALKGLLAEMPGTVDTASSGALNLKQILTYSRNAQQRKFTRKVLTDNGFDGGYIRFSSTDDVGYTQYAFSLRDARGARDTQKRLSRFDPELSHYKTFLVGEVPGAYGYRYVETKPIDGGNPCNAQEIVFCCGARVLRGRWLLGQARQRHGRPASLRERAVLFGRRCKRWGALPGGLRRRDQRACLQRAGPQAGRVVRRQPAVPLDPRVRGRYLRRRNPHRGRCRDPHRVGVQDAQRRQFVPTARGEERAQRPLGATTGAPRCAHRRPRRRRYQHATATTGRDQRAALQQPGVVVRSRLRLLLPDLVHDDTAARHGANRGAHRSSSATRGSPARAALRTADASFGGATTEAGPYDRCGATPREPCGRGCLCVRGDARGRSVFDRGRPSCGPTSSDPRRRAGHRDRAHRRACATPSEPAREAAPAQQPTGDRRGAAHGQRQPGRALARAERADREPVDARRARSRRCPRRRRGHPVPAPRSRTAAQRRVPGLLQAGRA